MDRIWRGLLMAGEPTYEELVQRVRELEQEAATRMKAEEPLRQSEKILSQIVQGSPIPTFVIDSKHIMTHCNRAYDDRASQRRIKEIRFFRWGPGPDVIG